MIIRQSTFENRQSRAFTLIELLVVIAIISLLVSILLPSLNRAKELARRVICAANERAIGQAIFLYNYENDNYMPGPVYIGQIMPSKSKDLSWRNRYLTWLLEPYMGDGDDAWMCPSNTGPTSVFYIVHPSPRLFGYAGGTPIMPMTFTQAVATEGMASDVWMLEDADGWYFYESSHPDWSPPHSMGRNVVYMDGHVDWLETLDRGIGALP